MTADQSNTLLRACQSYGPLIESKFRHEYALAECASKGLLPNGDGTPPANVTLDENGCIEGTDIVWADFAQATAGSQAVVTLTGANGKAIEGAWFRAKR